MIVLGLLLGCAGSHGPIGPNIGGNSVQSEKDSPLMGSHVLWGFYQISIDRFSHDIKVVPLRSAECNFNVTRLLQPPASPTNRIQVHLDSSASDFASGLFAVDITIDHPFPGVPKFAGFDVRGIFMGDGSVASAHYAGLQYASGQRCSSCESRRLDSMVESV